MTVSDVVRATLGPRGMDKLIHDEKGNTTISNDGATITQLLDIVHPAAKILVDIAKSQDSEVGDGTTTVVLLAEEFLQAAKPFIEDGVPGGAMTDSLLVNVVAFKKTFSYAEKENAEIRLKSGAKVVQSRLGIGDLATQWVAVTTGGTVQTSVYNIIDEVIFSPFVPLMSKRQVENERFNIFSGCPPGRTATIVLRGGADQFCDYYDHALWTLKNSTLVAGGDAIDMEISWYYYMPQAYLLVLLGKPNAFVPWSRVINSIYAPTEVACLVVHVDETLKNPKSAQGEAAASTMGGRGTAMVETTRSNTELRKDVDALKESCDRTEKTLEELRTMVATMFANQNQHSVHEGLGHLGENGGASPMNRDVGYQIPSKVSKVDFPHFNGEDLRAWLYKCEQFFEVDDTPSNAKVKLAAVYLEGKALQWHQMFMKGRLTREVPNWEEYIRALNDRFGALVYDDPMSELVNLKQVGNVQQYLDKFDEIVNCMDLPDHYALSCFLGGLKGEISVNVCMFRPKSLQEAISLAKLQEQAISITQKRPSILPKPNSFPLKSQPVTPYYKNHTTSPLYKPPMPQPPYTKPTSGQHRRLSPQEVDEKRSKGLCFWCDEKFTREHVCKNRRQLYLLEIPREEVLEVSGSAEDAHEGEEDTNEDKEWGESHVPMHAITGIHDFKTMRVTGVMKEKPIHILIDTGSTHNFMDLEAAKNLGLHEQKAKIFSISSVSTDLLQKVKDSWVSDSKIQKIIEDLT
ncbi:hypothetical protein BUALT_Bualt05G0019300 [Buddleja alternifolia]|uniref:Retrotransposon gag domain-containing protein n=1 Tax=Buddleja alternifolia TaxID=168488 RepID=A0AAV6XS95_9LAMI|nr:hypothetical protein BUALT_Bualt05G0019300 [Buddleja alternifolia]